MIALDTNLAEAPYSEDERNIALFSWVGDMCAKENWNLTAEEICDLLGGIPVRTYHTWKSKVARGEPVPLTRDIQERISLLLGIHKGLVITSPQGRRDLALSWFYTPNKNPRFEGLSYKDYMLKHKTIGHMYLVRRYLDSARG